MHDPIYKKLFGFPDMVRDLLRAVGPAWIDEVDLGTLEQLSAEHVGDLGQTRRGDAAWRVRFRNRPLHLLVVLEFQSTIDAHMALRNNEYTTLLYQELARRKELGPPGQWPPVVPVVLYNGDAPWTAALEMRDLIGTPPAVLSPCQLSQRSLLLDERRVAVDDLPAGNLMRWVTGFEQSETPEDLLQVAIALVRRLRSPAYAGLRAVFAEWMDQLAGRMKPGQTDWTPGATLEEATMTLAERVGQWPEQWRQEGRREGVAEGRREGVAEGRQAGVAQGRREGVAQGRQEGVAQERALLRRLAAVRFGDAVAGRIEDLLRATEDWDRLAAAAELIVRAETGPGLIDGIARTIRQSGQRS